MLRGSKMVFIACLTLCMSAVSFSNECDSNSFVITLDTDIMSGKYAYEASNYASKGVRMLKAAARTNDDTGVMLESMQEEQVQDTIGYEALHQNFVNKIDAYGVYADGMYIGVVHNKSDIENKLLNIRTEAYDTDVTDVTLSHDITFSDVQIEEEYVDDSAVMGVLDGYEDETIYYEVVPGDSISEIAEKYGKTLEDMYSYPWIWNGDVVTNAPDNFKVSLLVLIPTNKAYLRPIITKNEVECKQINFDTETLYDDTVVEGQIKVVTEGVYGEMEVEHLNTYDNGVLVDTRVLSSKQISEPVKEVVIVGTLKLPNMASGDGGSGKYFFPITESKAYISAYMGDGRGHKGMDIAAPRGTEIYSACAGEVIKVVTSGWGGGYGRHVMVENEDGNVCMYAHMSYTALDIAVGDEVKEGQLLGYVGSTGNSTGNHLHFEVRSSDGKFLNPTNFVSQK